MSLFGINVPTKDPALAVEPLISSHDTKMPIFDIYTPSTPGPLPCASQLCSSLPHSSTGEGKVRVV